MFDKYQARELTSGEVLDVLGYIAGMSETVMKDKDNMSEMELEVATGEMIVRMCVFITHKITGTALEDVRDEYKPMDVFKMGNRVIVLTPCMFGGDSTAKKCLSKARRLWCMLLWRISYQASTSPVVSVIATRMANWRSLGGWFRVCRSPTAPSELRPTGLEAK